MNEKFEIGTSVLLDSCLINNNQSTYKHIVKEKIYNIDNAADVHGKIYGYSDHEVMNFIEKNKE